MLVTTKHVVADEAGNTLTDLSYRINLVNGKSILLINDELLKAGGGNWFLSDTSDVAVRFMIDVKNADFTAIPQDMFLRKESIQSGTPALILGFRYRTPYFVVQIQATAISVKQAGPWCRS